MNPARSETYNPLARATKPQDQAELAKTRVRSASGRTGGQAAHDPFWDQSAEKLIRILAQCLHNQPDPSFRNLANLRHLVTGYDAHVAPQGQLGKIDQFVLQATQADQSTFQSYRSFVQGNLKTLQSVLMSADVALDAVATVNTYDNFAIVLGTDDVMRWWFMFTMPLCFILLAARAIENIIEDFTKYRGHGPMIEQAVIGGDS